MNELSAARGGAGSEIVAFDKRNGQTTGERINCNASAHAATADDHEVERFGFCAGNGGGAGRRTPRGGLGVKRKSRAFLVWGGNEVVPDASEVIHFVQGLVVKGGVCLCVRGRGSVVRDGS